MDSPSTREGGDGAMRRAPLAGAFAWTPRDGVDGPAILAAGFGMGVPVLLATLLGQTALGLAAAVGGLLVAGAATGHGFGEQVRQLAGTLAAAGGASVLAVLVAGQGPWTDAALAVLAGMAALVGGYSRPLALGTGRGIVFLAILLGIGDLSRDPARVLALMAAGALWTACLALAFGSLFRALAGRPAAATPATPTASALQKFRRWRRMLRQPEGWQYTLRLTGCLAVAALLRTTWPDHHFGWIAVTVAILCQRQPEALPLRVTQRAVGAALGVGLAGLVALPTLPGWLPAGLIALLGGLGPWLRGRNYLAYTASMTPLIILLFSGGRPAGTGPLVDRLLATAIGAALVVGANALLLRAAPVPPPNNLASRRQG